MSFVHLHVHTQFSLLDGVCRLDRLCSAAKERGQTAIAITDHGNLFGAVDFYKAAKNAGIKPIIGCEAYVAARSRFDKVHGVDSDRHHLILLCKNETGYKNLTKMISSAWVDGFYTKPRIDRELIEKYHDGLVCLSACIAGEIPKFIMNGDMASAEKTALWYDSVFGRGNFYLELQNHGIPEQIKVNDALVKISQNTGIPLVCTNDVHYIDSDDSKTQRVLICIATNKTINDENALEFESDQFYLKTEQEMEMLFDYIPEALSNTQKVADMCNFDFEFGNTKLPNFHVPDGISHFDYMRSICYDGLYKNYGEDPDKIYTDRLEYELSVIKNMGYVDYFLIVADFIDYAKKHGIPVGPGRGSGAGSIAAYCMGITNIDPIKYNLIFERFLNPERVSMPDIDVDFCYERREEVIDYVVKKYGADHVAQIVTFGTMAARGAIRDCGRAMGLPYSVVDNVAKKVPHSIGITLEKALQMEDDLKALYDSDPVSRELIDTAKTVEGMPRHASTHAAGVVITNKPVDEYVPLARNDDSVVTQFTMTTIEELGLLKMDFLGLRTLTVIDDCVKMIKKKNCDFDIEKIPIDDKNVFELFSSGKTDGIFQCESSGMRNVIAKLNPNKLEDIIAVIALYRPGPMDSIDTYISNRHNPENIYYKTPLLKGILDVTYGCIVYQEQVMQIFRTLAGYSLGRADVVRRAMSKKKHKIMEEEREHFCRGCAENNISRDTANEIFDDMSSFASYAFNKSHAAAYAVVAYRTAYLKCYYPCEFMASLLTSILDSSSKVAGYIEDCKKNGIKILPPDVNESYMNFTAEEESRSIRFGLLAIKNLGRDYIDKIISERSLNGKYTSFYSFCKRTYGRSFNRRAVESLIKSGALDGLGSNRREMLTNLPFVLSELDDTRRRNIEGQIGIFDLLSAGQSGNSEESFAMKSCSEMDLEALLAGEKETTGLYISSHPMEKYMDLSEKLRCNRVCDLLEITENDDNANMSVKIMGIVTDITKKQTKNGTTMAFVTVEDMTGSIEIIIFSKLMPPYFKYFEVGRAVFVAGRVSVREEEDAKIILDTAKTAAEIQIDREKRIGIFVRVDSVDSKEYKNAAGIAGIYRENGNIPFYFYFSDTKKYFPQGKVFLCDKLVTELKNAAGEKNVVVQN